MGYALSVMFTYAGILAWLTAGPVLLQKSFGFTPIEYGWAALAIGLSYGFLLMLLAGIMLLLIHQPTWVLLSIALYIFSTSFIMPNAFSKAFTPFAKIAGTAGALFVAMQISGGVISSAIIAYVNNTNPFAMTIIFIIVSMMAFIFFKMADSTDL